MKKLTLSKYVTTSLKWLLPLTFLELLVCLLYFTESADYTLFSMITLINFILLLPPGAYYLIMFFVFKNKCEKVSPSVGVITNWESGFFRYTGAVIMKVGDTEYSTSAYFSSEKAKEMVGKTVSYAIINQTLFIYEIKENSES